jgi:hypothetical protein
MSLKCNACGKRGGTLRPCSGCHRAHYCDSKCQLGNWTQHKANCGKKFDGRDDDSVFTRPITPPFTQPVYPQKQDREESMSEEEEDQSFPEESGRQRFEDWMKQFPEYPEPRNEKELEKIINDMMRIANIPHPSEKQRVRMIDNGLIAAIDAQEAKLAVRREMILQEIGASATKRNQIAKYDRHCEELSKRMVAGLIEKGMAFSGQFYGDLKELSLEGLAMMEVEGPDEEPTEEAKEQLAAEIFVDVCEIWQEDESLVNKDRSRTDEVFSGEDDLDSLWQYSLDRFLPLIDEEDDTQLAYGMVDETTGTMKLLSREDYNIAQKAKRQLAFELANPTEKELLDDLVEAFSFFQPPRDINSKFVEGGGGTERRPSRSPKRPGGTKRAEKLEPGTEGLIAAILRKGLAVLMAALLSIITLSPLKTAIRSLTNAIGEAGTRKKTKKQSPNAAEDDIAISGYVTTGLFAAVLITSAVAGYGIALGMYNSNHRIPAPYNPVMVKALTREFLMKEMQNYRISAEQETGRITNYARELYTIQHLENPSITALLTQEELNPGRKWWKRFLVYLRERPGHIQSLPGSLELVQGQGHDWIDSIADTEGAVVELIQYIFSQHVIRSVNLVKSKLSHVNNQTDYWIANNFLNKVEGKLEDLNRLQNSLIAANYALGSNATASGSNATAVALLDQDIAAIQTILNEYSLTTTIDGAKRLMDSHLAQTTELGSLVEHGKFGESLTGYLMDAAQQSLEIHENITSLMPRLEEKMNAFVDTVAENVDPTLVMFEYYKRVEYPEKYNNFTFTSSLDPDIVAERQALDAKALNAFLHINLDTQWATMVMQRDFHQEALLTSALEASIGSAEFERDYLHNPEALEEFLKTKDALDHKRKFQEKLGLWRWLERAMTVLMRYDLWESKLGIAAASMVSLSTTLSISDMIFGGALVPGEIDSLGRTANLKLASLRRYSNIASVFSTASYLAFYRLNVLNKWFALVGYLDVFNAGLRSSTKYFMALAERPLSVQEAHIEMGFPWNAFFLGFEDLELGPDSLLYWTTRATGPSLYVAALAGILFTGGFINAALNVVKTCARVQAYCCRAKAKKMKRNQDAQRGTYSGGQWTNLSPLALVLVGTIVMHASFYPDVIEQASTFGSSFKDTTFTLAGITGKRRSDIVGQMVVMNHVAVQKSQNQLRAVYAEYKKFQVPPVGEGIVSKGLRLVPPWIYKSLTNIPIDYNETRLLSIPDLQKFYKLMQTAFSNSTQLKLK